MFVDACVQDAAIAFLRIGHAEFAFGVIGFAACGFGAGGFMIPFAVDAEVFTAVFAFGGVVEAFAAIGAVGIAGDVWAPGFHFQNLVGADIDGAVFTKFASLLGTLEVFRRAASFACFVFSPFSELTDKAGAFLAFVFVIDAFAAFGVVLETRVLAYDGIFFIRPEAFKTGLLVWNIFLCCETAFLSVFALSFKCTAREQDCKRQRNERKCCFHENTP